MEHTMGHYRQLSQKSNGLYAPHLTVPVHQKMAKMHGA